MSKPQSRPETSLNSKLERNLTTYVITAGAAGMSLLALAQPAQAEVIYTPAHVRLGTGGLDLYFLDIDNDGSWDFTLRVTYFGGSIGLSVTERAYSQRIQCQTSDQLVFAKPRKVGGKIGPHKQFDGGNMEQRMAFETSHGGMFGPWVNVKNRYLGIQTFITGVDVNYGWIRLNVHFGQGHTVRAILTGYAYETIPGKPIVAGDEGTGTKSLGHLALGASGRARRVPATLGR